ncbi:hypothetical protein HDZ31DRAFT_45690 [Schizophyllum fasciatum]
MSRTLYVWPGEWGLPSMDPACLAAILYLQLAVPGRYIVSHCLNPDLSPTGQLPFLRDGDTEVSTLPSILDHVSAERDLNALAGLSATERAQLVAWSAHAQLNLGDLVSHVFFSVNKNWNKLTHPALASRLPIPQRYYMPGRIRELHRPRLTTAGLWNPGADDGERRPLKEAIKPRPSQSASYARAFEREKALEKARSSLDVYARRLQSNKLFFSSLTTLDFIVAAHVLLLVDPPFPENILRDLLNNQYPALVAHARHVLSLATPLPAAIEEAPGFSIQSLLPQLLLAPVSA